MSLDDSQQRRAVVKKLARAISSAAGRGGKSDPAVFSSGVAALDRILPGGRLRRGTLLEFVSSSPGCGATLLALVIIRHSLHERTLWAAIDAERQLYPSAIAALGLELRDVFLLQPEPGQGIAGSSQDLAWSIDQSLRCEGLSAVLAWPRRIEDRTFRRWQLAAEQSGVMGLLVRPREALREPSWAEARLLIEAVPSAGEDRKLRVMLMHAHGSLSERTIELVVGHERGHLSDGKDAPGFGGVASELAAATSMAGTSGAARGFGVALSPHVSTRDLGRHRKLP